ncbi:MAG: hypothetical protein AAGA54_02880 [Myxococcota bacterium]
MTLRRRTVLLGASALGLAACKRNKDPIVPEVWDEAPVPERAEALGKLAPPWPAPARAVLDSGLITYWLLEPEAPQVHVRLFIPDHDGQPFPALVARTIGRTLRAEVQRRLGRSAARAELQRAAGRLELHVTGPASALPRIARALAQPLDPAARSDKLATSLVRAREKEAREGTERTALDVATACTVGALLGLPMDSQRIDPTRAGTVRDAVLLDAWQRMLDPRRCALVVHAPQAAEEVPAIFDLLARWRGEGRADAADSSLARLRWTPPEPTSASQLFTDGGAPLRLPTEPVSRGAKLVVGRLLDTPTPQDRAMARLAQRIAAETLDVRVAVVGPHALLMANETMRETSAEATAQRLIEALGSLGRTRAPQQQLFTAAQLWLGARVVQASLDGEDWTALWSQSMDLATTDADIPRALATDAAAMLAIDGEGLAAFTKANFDPKLGTPGWAWSLAGATRKMERQLSRFAATVPVGPEG